MSPALKVAGLQKPEQVQAFDFSNDGGCLAAVDRYGYVHILETKTGETIKSLQEDAAQLFAVSFTSDSHTLATGDFGGTISIWDTTSWKRTSQLRGHNNVVGTVRFLPNSNLLISGGFDGVVLWNVDTEQQIWERRFSSPLHKCTVSHDGTRVAAVLPSGDVAVMNADGETICTLVGRAVTINHLAFSPNEPIMAGAYDDGIVAVWDLRTSELLTNLSVPAGNVQIVEFSPDGDRIVAATTGKGTTGLFIWRRSSVDQGHIALPDFLNR
jgi:WD40 repeat protein